MLVSVIVPVYNVEEYLDKCMESIQKQCYTNFEVILINDGSTDRSSRLCDEYSSKNVNVRTIHQSNQGVCAARNRGIREACGEYIVFIDPDDMVSEFYLDKMVEHMNQAKVDMVVTGYTNEIQKLYHETNQKLKLEGCKAEWIYSNILNNGIYDGYIWNKMFRREILISHNVFFPLGITLWEDLYFVIQYLRCIQDVVFINQNLYYYRIREGSATAEISTEKLKSKLDVCELFLELEKDKTNKFYKAAEARYTEIMIEYAYRGIGEKLPTKYTTREIIGKIEKSYKNVSLKYKLKYYGLQIYSLFSYKR